MKINFIKNNLFRPDSLNNKNEKKSDVNKPSQKDAVEISAEAKKIYDSEKSVKDLENIKFKVKTGYYKDQKILEKVAEKILNEFSSEK